MAHSDSDSAERIVNQRYWLVNTTNHSVHAGKVSTNEAQYLQRLFAPGISNVIHVDVISDQSCHDNNIKPILSWHWSAFLVLWSDYKWLMSNKCRIQTAAILLIQYIFKSKYNPGAKISRHTNKCLFEITSSNPNHFTLAGIPRNSTNALALCSLPLCSIKNRNVAPVYPHGLLKQTQCLDLRHSEHDKLLRLKWREKAESWGHYYRNFLSYVLRSD